MTRFVMKRLLWAIPILFIASILVFVAVRSSTDPVAALARNPRVNPQALEEYKHSLGLDRSLPVQYWTWLKSFVTFDWGQSLSSRRPVWPDIKNALVNTIILGTFAFIVHDHGRRDRSASSRRSASTRSSTTSPPAPRSSGCRSRRSCSR